MVAVSDVLVAANGGGVPLGKPQVAGEDAAAVQARGRASLATTAGDGKVIRAAKVVWSDVRDSWWLPASVPTVAKAWSERWPDRDRVPGGSEVLYTAWAAYNFAALLPVALFNLLVGVLTPLMFVLRHPARLALALLIAVPIVVAVAAA